MTPFNGVCANRVDGVGGLSTFIFSPCVVIGRRDGLKSRCRKLREGSNPSRGTIILKCYE